jgi:hypothetical protein
MFCSEESWDANGAEDWDAEEYKNKPNGMVLFRSKLVADEHYVHFPQQICK